MKTFKKGGIHPPEAKDSALSPIETLAPENEIVMFLSQHIGAPSKPVVKVKDKVLTGSLISQASSYVSSPVHSPVSGIVKKIEKRTFPGGIEMDAIIIENDKKDEICSDIDESPDLIEFSREYIDQKLNKIKDLANDLKSIEDIDINIGPTGVPSFENSLKISFADYLKTKMKESNMTLENIIKDENIPFEKIKNDAIRNIIGKAGIVGLGGATFPTSVKLNPPKPDEIDALILNGAECEPYLTSDHRLMLEYTAKIVQGLRILMSLFNNSKGYIGIESNKKDCVSAFEDACRDYKDIEVVPLKVKYPQGGEKQLIKAILNREVPSQKLPFDVGVIVQNVATSAAVYDAVAKNKPLYERVVTIGGKAIGDSKNLMLKMGTPLKDIMEYCGGIKDPKKIIFGGPMMGKAISHTDVNITKGTSGILFLDESEAPLFEENQCIRCARCISVCPMGLAPTTLYTLTKGEKIEDIGNIGVMDCIECGSCSYVCPSKIYLVQWIRLGKMKFNKIKNTK